MWFHKNYKVLYENAKEPIHKNQKRGKGPCISDTNVNIISFFSQADGAYEQGLHILIYTILGKSIEGYIVCRFYLGGD